LFSLVADWAGPGDFPVHDTYFMELNVRASSISFLFFLSALVSCQPGSDELTEAKRTQIQAAVLEADAGWWDAWASMENLEDYMSYFSDWFESPITGWQSTEALRVGSVDMWGETESWDYEFGDRRVKALAPNVAALEGRIVSIVTDTADAAVEWSQRYTQVWSLEESGWKILTCSFSTSRRNVQ
jgi:hypothetical protein